MIKFSIGLVALLLAVGCSSGEVGQAEIDKAYPAVSQSQLEAELAKEGKLEEYKANRARDAAVQAGQGGGQ